MWMVAPGHWRVLEDWPLTRLLRVQKDILYLLHQPWSASHVPGQTYTRQQKIFFWSSLPFNSGHTFRRGFAPLRNRKFAKGSPFNIDNCLLVSDVKYLCSHFYSFLKNTSVPLFAKHHPPIRGSPWSTTIQLCPADLLVALYIWWGCLFWELKILISNKIW